MICFRDQSYCAAGDRCQTTPCGRRFTAEDQAAAERWWGGPDAPVAFADYHATCEDYSPASPPFTLTGGRDDG